MVLIVYNIEVNTNHTYCVGVNSIVVHNLCTHLRFNDIDFAKNARKHLRESFGSQTFRNGRHAHHIIPINMAKRDGFVQAAGQTH